MINEFSLTLDNNVIAYHATECILGRNIDLQRLKKRTDFGKGFYLSKDKLQTMLFRADKPEYYVYEYKLSLDGLKVLNLELDEIWLLLIMYNRNLIPNWYSGLINLCRLVINRYDVIVGPIADDRMYNYINGYLNGQILIDSRTLISVLNAIQLKSQYCIKTMKAVERLKLINTYEIKGVERDKYKEMLYLNRAGIANKIEEAIMSSDRGGYFANKLLESDEILKKLERLGGC